MTTLIAIVQARMSSSRLPGKSLLPIGEKSILEWQVQRLIHSRLFQHVVIATSDDCSDDPIVDFCNSIKVPIVRGSLSDLYARYCSVLEQFPTDFFLRYCADRPFFDMSLVRDALECCKLDDVDLISNVLNPSYPKGLTVEIVRSATFQSVDRTLFNLDDREHVLNFFYKHRERFRIKELPNYSENLSHINLCVDTLTDYEAAKRIVKRAGMGWLDTPWQDIYRIYREERITELEDHLAGR